MARRYMVQTLFMIILLLPGSLFAGCADIRSHDVRLLPDVQVGRYIETKDLNQLPNRRLAGTSFIDLFRRSS